MTAWVFDGLKRLVSAMVLSVLLCDIACAKQVGEAVQDMGAVGDEDPNGYTLMMVSIGIIFTCALTLIGVTTWYMLKAKKKG